MKVEKSFVENYHFVEKQNTWMDKDSVNPQTFLVGAYPVNSILKTDKIGRWDDYGIPAGLVMFSGKKYTSVGGGEGGAIARSPIDHIPVHVDDVQNERLMNLIHVYTREARPVTNTHKTRKNKKS